MRHPMVMPVLLSFESSFKVRMNLKILHLSLTFDDFVIELKMKMMLFYSFAFNTTIIAINIIDQKITSEQNTKIKSTIFSNFELVKWAMQEAKAIPVIR